MPDHPTRPFRELTATLYLVHQHHKYRDIFHKKANPSVFFTLIF